MKNRNFKWNQKKIILLLFVAACCLFSAPLSAFAQEQSEEENSKAYKPEIFDAGDNGSDMGEEKAVWPQGPSIMAESGIVMEVSTGTILYEKNIDEQHAPASITKIMTVLLGIENCKLDEIVTVPHEAVYMEDKGSHIALDEGEELTVEQCLYAIMLASANDAAYSLAIHVGGTIENFAAMMNEKAKELGCKNTNFVNPHGLPDDRHVTTAYDMALITKAALSYDIFREVSGTVFYEIPASEHQKDDIPMYHHHKMLSKGKYYYEGAFCGKPGYTVTALNTLMTCAKRDDMELICVTMKTEGRQVYKDTASLFDFGFENFKKINISQNETEFKKIPVFAAAGENTGEEVAARIEEGCCVVVPKQAKFSNLKKELSYGTGEVKASRLAEIHYSYGGHFVGSAVLKAADAGWKMNWSKTAGSNQPQEASLSENSAKKGASSKGGSVFFWVIAGILLLAALGFAALVYYRYLQIERKKRRARRDRRDDSNL